ncbi:MAG: dihydroorotase [Armatimonadota bacterium]
MVVEDDVLVRGGRVVDPASGMDAVADVLVRDGTIVAIGPRLRADDAETIDASGKIVAPGLIDVHVHLREPGQEEKETIETGTQAAVAGGFTTVCCMPNTEPPLDRPEVVRELRRRIDAQACCRVYPIGAATVDNRGRKLTDFAALKREGCVAVSDDAFPIQDVGLMREACSQAKAIDLPIIPHCEAEGGDGKPDWWPEAEGIARWIAAARETGARVHMAHVSTLVGAARIWGARREGVENVSAETTPHYWTCTSEAVAEFGANAKMNPPLREGSDVAAIRARLVDDTLSVIATDHAPHTQEEKSRPLDSAPNGVVGLETALGLVLTELVHSGVLSLSSALAKMTVNPARTLGLGGGRLAIGQPADITIMDPDAEWTVEPSAFRSKGRNTPFAGQRLRGKAVVTIVGGRVRMAEGSGR